MVTLTKLKRTTLLLLFLSFVSKLYSQQIHHDQPDQNRLVISFSTGFEVQNLRWSIAGNSLGTNPNIYSELIWTDLRSSTSNVKLKYKPMKRLAIEVEAERAYIKYGKATDMDYQSDNRAYNSFAGYFDSNEGEASHYKGLFSYSVLTRNTWMLNVQAGYRLKQQQLFLLDNNGIYDKDLRSTYTTCWAGLFGGVEASVNLTDKLNFNLFTSYTQANYKATGDWNLISNFEHPVSYRHTANGYAIEYSARFIYQVDKKWLVFINGRYGYWKTGKGVDILYLNNGQKPETQLNGVMANSYFVGPGVSLQL